MDIQMTVETLVSEMLCNAESFRVHMVTAFKCGVSAGELAEELVRQPCKKLICYFEHAFAYLEKTNPSAVEYQKQVEFIYLCRIHPRYLNLMEGNHAEPE